MRVSDPIVYSSLAGTDYFYSNNPAVSTSGIELSVRGKTELADIQATYSAYRGHPIDAYRVPQDDSALLGAPKNKFTVSAAHVLGRSGWRLQESFVWYDKFFADDFDPNAINSQGDPLSTQEHAARGFLNVSASHQGEDWRFSIGVSDLLDRGRLLPQASHNESTPYPGAGRRFWIEFSRSWR
jgi:outer membrane receptor protein involved in Fe transport